MKWRDNREMTEISDYSKLEFLDLERGTVRVQKREER